MQCAFLHVSALPIRPARFTNRRMKRLCKMCLSRSQAWTFPAALTAVVVSVLYQVASVRLITRPCESAELPPFRCCPPRPVKILNWKRHCHGFPLSGANNIHPVPVPSGKDFPTSLRYSWDKKNHPDISRRDCCHLI